MNELPIILENISHRSPASINYILINYRRERRQRLLQALALMALTGFAVVPELCALMETSLRLTPGNHSVRNAFTRDLPATGLVVLETPQFIGPSRLGLVRLTELGRRTCPELGMEVAVSEWEQLILKHNGLQFPRHTLGVLAFAYQARRRGWNVMLLPSTVTPVEPDLQVSLNGNDCAYVEFETRARAHNQKWEKSNRWNKYVAVATFTAAMRRVLVDECQNFPMRGQATDLETLSKDGDALGDLWQERWGRW
jgi:hypothetical protein